MIETEKLQKVLARAALGSRRQMEQAIAEGQVTVNGKIATLGDRVSARDKIMFRGRDIHNSPQRARIRVLMYNKPEGEICSRSDPEGRPTVFKRLPKITQGRWIVVGRLDFNTSGLLFFVNDGELANGLMHPAANIEREYLVRVFGGVDDQLLQRLREGVLLDDGPAKFANIKAKDSQTSNRWFFCSLREGRNREVRRLWESQGLKVNRLKRVRFADFTLPSFLKSGQWLELEHTDVQKLVALTNTKVPKQRLKVKRDEQLRLQRQERQLRRGGKMKKRNARTE